MLCLEYEKFFYFCIFPVKFPPSKHAVIRERKSYKTQFFNIKFGCKRSVGYDRNSNTVNLIKNSSFFLSLLFIKKEEFSWTISKQTLLNNFQPSCSYPDDVR